jgi:hypothetical protein
MTVLDDQSVIARAYPIFNWAQWEDDRGKKEKTRLKIASPFWVRRFLTAERNFFIESV